MLIIHLEDVIWKDNGSIELKENYRSYPWTKEKEEFIDYCKLIAKNN